MVTVDGFIVTVIVATPCFFFGMLGFFAEQGFAIFLRNLVIIGVDFAERQEPVATNAACSDGSTRVTFAR